MGNFPTENMKIIKNLLKIAAAGLTAFAILCGLTLIYYQKPMYRKSQFGNTDFNWPSGSRWQLMTEGISRGRFDQWGFNNPEIVENPDILVLGSSHMEATYVRQSETMAQQLQQLLEGRATVYNMGIAGNHLPKSLQYLPDTLEIFEKTPRLIVIEAQAVEMDGETVRKIMDHTLPSIYEPKSEGEKVILGLPYLRLLAKQKSLGLLDQLFPPRKPPEIGPAVPPQPVLPADAPEGEVYDRLFPWLQQLQQKYSTQILIFYHPTQALRPDGGAEFQKDPYVQVFAEKCALHGIGFLDLTEDLEALYLREHKMGNGFCTGEMGTGHMNAWGHQAAARAVYDWIVQKEGN